MTQLRSPTVLLVGMPPGLNLNPYAFAATTADEAVTAIRMTKIDLMLVGYDSPAIDVWALMRLVSRSKRPRRWILASSQITREEEILARSLGAMAVMNEDPTEQWIQDRIASIAAFTAVDYAKVD